jgi:hypothetical protein
MMHRGLCLQEKTGPLINRLLMEINKAENELG